MSLEASRENHLTDCQDRERKKKITISYNINQRFEQVGKVELLLITGCLLRQKYQHTFYYCDHSLKCSSNLFLFFNRSQHSSSDVLKSKLQFLYTLRKLAEFNLLLHALHAKAKITGKKNNKMQSKTRGAFLH